MPDADRLRALGIAKAEPVSSGRDYVYRLHFAEGCKLDKLEPKAVAEALGHYLSGWWTFGPPWSAAHPSSFTCYTD